MLMLMLMTTIDYYHSLCLLFLSGGFLKRDTPKPPWVSILKLSIVTKWKLFHVIWNIFQIWETAALFQKYSRFMFRNSRNYEKKPDLKKLEIFQKFFTLSFFFWMTTQATPTKHKPRHPEKAFDGRHEMTAGKMRKFSVVSRDFHTQVLHGAGIFTYPLVMADIAMV